jgi:hypothetical protein
MYQDDSRAPRLDVINAAYDTVDHLTALAPPGWRSVMIRRTPAAGGRLAVSQISVRPIEGEHRPLPVRLNLDPALRRGLLGAALDRVQEGLRQRGIIWDGLSAMVRRDDAKDDAPIAFHVTTFRGKNIAKIKLDRPAAERILTRALCDVVVSEAPDWDDRRETFGAIFGDDPAWRFVFEDSVAIVKATQGPPVRCPAQVLGAYIEPESSWCWSWMNPRYHDYHHDEVVALRESPEAIARLGLLRRPSFRCELGFARMVADLAAHRLAAVALEQQASESPGVRLFVAAKLETMGPAN